MVGGSFLRLRETTMQGTAMERQVRHAEKWLRRHALFDETCDLVLLGLGSLEEARDSYPWELGYGFEERER